MCGCRPVLGCVFGGALCVGGTRLSASGLERCIADGQCRCRSGWLAGADRMMPVVGERALELDTRGCLQTGDSKLDVVMDESSWACSIPFVRWRFWRGVGVW